MSLPTELEAAIATLKAKSCLDTPVITDAAERDTLRQSIQIVTQETEWENLGICADNATEALTSLRQYLQALGYNPDVAIEITPWQDRPVYLKFNTQKMAHYLDDYEGQYRGVLIACQAETEELVGTYGYFPLDLFA